MIISLSAWMMEERSTLIAFTDPTKPLEVAEVLENRLRVLGFKPKKSAGIDSTRKFKSKGQGSALRQQLPGWLSPQQTFASEEKGINCCPA